MVNEYNITYIILLYLQPNASNNMSKHISAVIEREIEVVKTPDLPTLQNFGWNG